MDSENRQFVVRVLDVAQGAGALVQVDDEPPRWLSKDDVLAVSTTEPPADRWAGFSDDEVRWLIAVLSEAAHRHLALTDVARALTEDVRSEYQRRTRLAGEAEPNRPEPRGSGRNYRQVSRLEAGLTWSPRDNIDHSHASDLSAWSSYNHTRREFVDDAAEPEKEGTPERWSGWSDEELDRLGQMLGDGGHELADLRAEVRRRHEADDGLSDAERRAVEVLAAGEWPDQPKHGVWRAYDMVAWLKAAGIVLAWKEDE
jgi:hypothetical protein